MFTAHRTRILDLMLMRRNFSHIALAALMASMAAWPLVAQSQTNQPRKAFVIFKAGAVRGAAVENKDGENLGKLRAFVVDPRTGRTRYVVVQSGGFLGVGSKVKPVPPDWLFAETAKRNVVGINISSDDWRHAPTCKLSEIERLDQSEVSRQVTQFYRQLAPAMRADPAAEEPMLSPTARPGKSGADASASHRLCLASDFIGKPVMNRQQEKVGEVLDLLVAFDSRAPVFALISPGKLVRDREPYAIQLVAMEFNKSKFVADAPRDALERARSFGPQVFEDIRAGRRDIYRYADQPR